MGVCAPLPGESGTILGPNDLYSRFLTTASVGLSVIIAADGDDSSEFSVEFQYSPDLSQLTIFYNGEQDVRASDVVIDGLTTCRATIRPATSPIRRLPSA